MMSGHSTPCTRKKNAWRSPTDDVFIGGNHICSRISNPMLSLQSLWLSNGIPNTPFHFPSLLNLLFLAKFDCLKSFFHLQFHSIPLQIQSLTTAFNANVVTVDDVIDPWRWDWVTWTRYYITCYFFSLWYSPFANILKCASFDKIWIPPRFGNGISLISILEIVKKVKSYCGQVPHAAGAYPGFRSMM